MEFAIGPRRSGATGGRIPARVKNLPESARGKVIVGPADGLPKPGGRGRLTVPAWAPRKVPPPITGGPAYAGAPRGAARAQKRHSPRRRMTRPATTLARDLVRRRLPAGASPSRRELAPGRTLSRMPSEQKGAYGGHLASYVRTAPLAGPSG